MASVLNELHEQKYIAYNVGSDKIPINGRTNKRMKNWSKLNLKEIKSLCDYNNKSIGMRMGLQENGRLIANLDFDVSKKTNGVYCDCIETKDMLDKFIMNNNDDGVYESATIGNMNVLVDYTDAPRVRTKIAEMDTAVIKSNNIGFELLAKSNSVLPPTETICKKTNKLRQRKRLNSVMFKKINDDDYTSNFILDFIQSAQKDKPVKVASASVAPTGATGPVGETGAVSQKSSEELIFYLDLIAVIYFDDYCIWRSIIWAMKNENMSKDIAREYSQKSNKYDDYAFDNTWDNAPVQIKMNVGTIKHFAKKSKPKEYTEYFHTCLLNDKDIEKMIYNHTDRNLAVLGEILLKDDIVATEQKQLYLYDNGFWIDDEDALKYTLQQKICSLLDNVSVNLSLKRQDITDIESDEYKTLVKKQNDLSASLVQICSNSKLNNVFSQLKLILSVNKKDITFDTNKPNVFCFKNISFDLETGNEYVIQKDDYISQHTGYDYIQPTQTHIDEIDNIFKSIFPSEEMRKTYLSILRTGLSGMRQEKLFIANGRGRNGKGLLNELMSATCGNYFYKMNIDVLTKPIKSGANQEVANLHQKRFCVANEPNDKESILGGNIKRLTGDNVINARGLYSQNTETILNGTFVLELNKLIKLDGRIDDAIVARLVNIQFETFFTDDKTILTNNEHARPLNPYYKESEFRDTFKHALFYYLLHTAPKKLYICDASRDATRDYLLKNNEFYNWINEIYEKVETPTIYNFIKVKDIYNLWKTSDYYMNMSKEQKRKAVFKYFIDDYIKDNMELKAYFVKDYQKYEDKKRVIKSQNVIIGFIKKPNECSINIDDDELFDG